MKKVANKAFTLIELLVVIAIIGILSSVVLASLSGARESAKIQKTISNFKQIETAMMMWMDATGKVQWTNENLDTYGNRYLNNMVENTELDQYLTTVPDPPFGDRGWYRYRRYNVPFECGSSSVVEGVNLYIRGTDVTKEIANNVQNIVENDDNLNCGKIRWRGNVGSDNDEGDLIYGLSNNGKL